MALLPPIAGAVLTQGFGPSRLAAEPAMFGSDSFAYWQDYRGLDHYDHFHAAIDLAAPLGTAIAASEAGTVVYSGPRDNGGGLCMKVEIRPNVWYEHAHCSVVVQPVGRKVTKGQLIARVGSTGTATGNHSHFSVLMKQVEQGVGRTFLYDPRLFLPGGRLADDPRIRPLVISSGTKVALNGPGINVRSTPDLDVGAVNVFAVSSAAPQGIYRRSDGRRIADLFAPMTLRRWVTTDDGTWGEVWLNYGYRFCKKELLHFV